jgi:hypothetical protein
MALGVELAAATLLGLTVLSFLRAGR